MAATGLNTDAVLTEEMIEKLKVGLGVEYPVKRQWHSEATRDNIKHWAFGIGDDNPLWVDEDYGRASNHGVNLAPPTFLYSTYQGPRHENSKESRGGGLPGIHAIWASDNWEFYRHIRRGDEIKVMEKLAAVRTHVSQFGGLTAELVTEHTFRTGAGELLAKHEAVFMHHGRSTAAGKNKHAGLTRHVWTPEELAGIERDIDAERRRGAEDLKWDEVSVGDTIGQVVKGPLTATEMITFVQGWGGPFMMASEIAHKYIRKHPKANVPDRHTNAPDFPERAHWDAEFARECGFPDGYDFGGQRIAWMIHAVTNWMGDNGLLRSMRTRLTRLNIPGDATWCTGTVTGKRIGEGGEKLIDLDLVARNQRGLDTALTTATVQAPR